MEKPVPPPSNDEVKKITDEPSGKESTPSPGSKPNEENPAVTPPEKGTDETIGVP